MAVRRATLVLLTTCCSALAPVRQAPRASMALPPDAAGLPLAAAAATPPARLELESLATGAAFDAAVGAGRCAVLVSAPWCRACRVVTPKFKRLAAEFEGRVAFFDCSHPNLNAVAGASAYLDETEVARDLTVTPMVMLYEDGVRRDVYRAGPTRFKATREKLEAWCGGGDPADVVPPEPARAAAAGSAIDRGSPRPPRRDLLADMRRRGRTRASLRRPHAS